MKINYDKLTQLLKQQYIHIKHNILDEEEAAHHIQNYLILKTKSEDTWIEIGKLQFDYESVIEDRSRNKTVYIVNNEISSLFQSQGYGTLLIAYFLYHELELDKRNYCTCYCSPMNYGFYLKNGFMPFHYSSPEHWFGLEQEQQAAYFLENYPAIFSNQPQAAIADKKAIMPLIFYNDSNSIARLNMSIEKLGRRPSAPEQSSSSVLDE